MEIEERIEQLTKTLDRHQQELESLKRKNKNLSMELYDVKDSIKKKKVMMGYGSELDD